MSDGLIERAWLSYERAVVPAAAGEIQRRDLRWAFFGGARALFHTLNATVVDDSPEPSDADLAFMQAIDDELEAHVASVRAYARGRP